MFKKILFSFIIFSSVQGVSQENLSKEKILQNLSAIEADPFSKDIIETTGETLLWIQKDSGIGVMDIELFVNALKNSERELAPYLIRAYFFGKVQAVLKEKNPADGVDAKVAGLENLVNVYRQYLQDNPEAANQEANKLAEMEEKAELEEYVKGIANRNGLSFETARIPKSILEEYQWMKANFPDAEMLRKKLIQKDGRTYDVFEMQSKENKNFELYFDTSIIL